MDIRSAFFVMLTACVVFTLCFILIRSRGASVYSVILKALASFCFVMCFVVSLVYDTNLDASAIGIAMGLVAGLIGDILLDLKLVYKEHSNEYLTAGFVSFGVGHLFYIFALVKLGMSKWPVGNVILPLVISLAIAGVMTVGSYYMMKKIMKFDFGKHTIITNVYSFILFFITALAIAFSIANSAFVSFAIGLVLFTVSDLILSMQYFGDKADNNILQVLNHTSYYLAQIVIASTIFISMLV